MNFETQSTLILEKKIKFWTIILMVGLFLSGLTAIPVVSESFLLWYFLGDSEWVRVLCDAISVADKKFPSAFYGLDWLAYAHFILALLYYGVYKDPIRNEWLVQFGIIISLLIFPYAFVFGHFRDIPVWWRCIDCSFGFFAFLIFYRIRILLNQLKNKL